MPRGPEIDRRTSVSELPTYLSPEELFRYLKIGRSLGYELIRRGEIPSVRFGRLIRIPRSALERAE